MMNPDSNPPTLLHRRASPTRSWRWRKPTELKSLAEEAVVAVEAGAEGEVAALEGRAAVAVGNNNNKSKDCRDNIK